MTQLHFRQFIAICVFCLVSTHIHATHTGSVVVGSSGTASSINTESGVTLPKGRWSVGLRTEFVKFDTLSNRKLTRLREEDPEADLHSADSLLTNSLGVSFGVTDDFTIGLRVPHVLRQNIREPEHGHGEDEEEEEAEHADEEEGEGEEAEHDEGAEDIVERLGDAEGIGDTVVFGQYRFYRGDESKRHASLLFGVKTPTGKRNRKSDEGELLEAEFQPGSDSWDGLFGLAYTQFLGPVALNSSILYSLVTEGTQDTDLGDVLSYNGALSYRFGSQGAAALGLKSSDFAVDMIVELNGQWRNKLEFKGRNDDNSGGHQLYVSPGLRFVFGPRVSLGLSFGVPIISDFNGDQDDLDYRATSSLNFFF